ncbi:recombinase family protein [Sphaerisporangium album]|uniref:recombinase family protein n=1 Tax=Sphaerisporangium album TaxID=509200 RepID=UPI001C68D4AD|nr:recombinase family protein [Sphaerisporangium album]
MAPRPAWQRLLSDIQARTTDAIVCWHVDRLTRRPRELGDIIDLADRRDMELATVTGEIDITVRVQAYAAYGRAQLCR